MTPEEWAESYGTIRKLRLGIAGARFGTSFQFHEHPNCTIQAVADIDLEARDKLMGIYGCTQGYDSLESMLNDSEVEAVFLATPVPLHAKHTLMCLEAGKHVLSAVPAAMTLEECGQMVEAVERTGLTYMMAETSYWQQATISARKFYEEGAFGNLYYV